MNTKHFPYYDSLTPTWPPKMLGSKVTDGSYNPSSNTSNFWGPEIVAEENVRQNCASGKVKSKDTIKPKISFMRNFWKRYLCEIKFRSLTNHPTLSFCISFSEKYCQFFIIYLYQLTIRPNYHLKKFPHCCRQSVDSYPRLLINKKS